MKEVIVYSIIVYLIILNVIGFASMGIDKRRAIKNIWRIRERTLLLFAFLGGGIGSLFGMRIFKHKTKHIKFKILVPIAVVINVLITIYIYSKLI